MYSLEINSIEKFEDDIVESNSNTTADLETKFCGKLIKRNDVD